MSSVPDGGRANQPEAVTILSPPSDAPLPGAFDSRAVMGSPARVVASTSLGENDLIRARAAALAGSSSRVYVEEPSFVLEARVVDGRIASGASKDLRAEQVEQEAVLVRRPDGAVAA